MKEKTFTQQKQNSNNILLSSHINSPILSIIIPTYNMEKYLRHCLDSLIVPNMYKVEVLVINDGSKDSSSAIGHEYQDKYPQTFRVIDKENGNYGSCVNRGLKEATGKYVKVLDADDSYDSKNFSTYIDKLENIDADLVLTDYDIVNEKGKITSAYKYAEKTNIIADKIVDFADFTKANPNHVGQMHGFTYNRKVFDRLNYHQHEGISYTDVQWCYNPITHVDKMYYCPLTVYKYLKGREGQTMQNQGKHIKQVMTVLSDMIDFYENGNWNRGKYSTYLTAMAKAQISVIYGNGLYEKSYPMDILIEFDNKLRKHPYFFELSNTVTDHHVEIVKIWRKRNRQSMPLWISLYRFVRTIGRKLKNF